jgi:hypothetical protein
MSLSFSVVLSSDLNCGKSWLAVVLAVSHVIGWRISKSFTNSVRQKGHNLCENVRILVCLTVSMVMVVLDVMRSFNKRNLLNCFSISGKTFRNDLRSGGLRKSLT